jgi:LemA protein
MKGRSMSRGLKITLGVIGAFLLVAAIAISWIVGTYNNLVTANESVHGAWSQVENQYQRRYDLVPNLVETVKGFAKQEQTVLLGVTQARASVGQIKMTPEMLRDPQAFQRFQQAQDGLGSALQRLLVVTENYPQLKSNENFLALQSQLEGTENRIAVERRRFNEVVQAYNTMIRRFPGSVVAGFGNFTEAQYFKSTAGAEKAPQVKF